MCLGNTEFLAYERLMSSYIHFFMEAFCKLLLFFFSFNFIVLHLKAIGLADDNHKLNEFSSRFPSFSANSFSLSFSHARPHANMFVTHSQWNEYQQYCQCVVCFRYETKILLLMCCFLQASFVNFNACQVRSSTFVQNLLYSYYYKWTTWYHPTYDHF